MLFRKSKDTIDDLLDEAKEHEARLPDTTEHVVAPFPKWLREVSPNLNWEWPYLQHIIAALERVSIGECQRLMLFIPPRHGKTELVTIRYDAWRLERNPADRIILGAYNQELTRKFSRKIRRIVKPRVELFEDSQSVDHWETTKEGGLRAAGVGTGVTGLGANLLVIDDPIKNRAEAESQVYRDRCYEWFTDDLYTRLEPDAAIILIQTRWHHADLAGRLLQKAQEGGEQWEVVSLPALAEEDRVNAREIPGRKGDMTGLKNVIESRPISITLETWHARFIGNVRRFA